MKDNEFHALMMGRVLKRDNDDGTGLMIKLNNSGILTERLYDKYTNKTISTRAIDHVDISTLEMSGWTILPETTPLI